MDFDHQEMLRAIGGRGLSSVMHDPVPGFLFENCFRERSITVFVAPPHRGKTLLMLDMALCLDMEMPLMGRFQPLKGRTIFFLGLDAPSWDYGLQARKLCIGHGLGPQARDLLELNGVWKSGKKITDPAVRDWLNNWKGATGADVLFIDTHRSSHGANENDSMAMELVWDKLKELRDGGWTIIMSHHTSKPTEILQEDVHSARGSTVIGASADFIYTLNKRSRKDKRVQVRCVKGRGAADDDDPFTFFDIEAVESDEMLNGRPLYGLRLVAAQEDAMKVMLELMAKGPQDRKALCARVKEMCPKVVEGMTPEALYRYVDNRLIELREMGKVKRLEHGVWGMAGTP